mmetsp:Transcript_8639/g.21259  ORF Transcript_8639/g.21259 Transcript_8639/m.21259 type:complete len:247 (-) Transcript_8639:322-1062(-)
MAWNPQHVQDEVLFPQIFHIAPWITVVAEGIDLSNDPMLVFLRFKSFLNGRNTNVVDPENHCSLKPKVYKNVSKYAFGAPRNPISVSKRRVVASDKCESNHPMRSSKNVNSNIGSVPLVLSVEMCHHKDSHDEIVFKVIQLVVPSVPVCDNNGAVFVSISRLRLVVFNFKIESLQQPIPHNNSQGQDCYTNTASKIVIMQKLIVVDTMRQPFSNLNTLSAEHRQDNNAEGDAKNRCRHKCEGIAAI